MKRITLEAIEARINKNQLVLDGCQIKDEDIITICEYLDKHPNVTKLWLDQNQITSEGVETLSKNKTVTFLSLWQNKIDDKGAIILAENNESIVHLNLYDNQITEKGKSALEDMLNRNQNKVKASNINMMVLGGFIAVAGIALTALAFTLLNSVTFGVPAIAVTCLGLGLFATSTYKNSNETTAPALEI